MSDRLVFLRAIRANPDEDTARLVFADWLDEHDDPLGELIRVQLELEPIRYRIDNPRAMELHKREDELLHAHRDDWITTNNLLTNPADFGPVFRRGLPDYACLSLDTFLQNGEAIFAAYPTLREVTLYGIANRCWEFTLSPLLANLETLEIADWPTEEDAISLSVSPHLEGISRFKLWVSDESHFLRELVRQANRRWPRNIELVQLHGGGSSGVPAAVGWRDHYREQADRAAEFANATLRRVITHVTRPYERQFPLNGEIGQSICAGHLPDGTPALVAGGSRNWILVTFTQEGRVRNELVRTNPVRIGYSAVRDIQFHNWVADELQLEPGLIHVREFAVENMRVDLWPPDLQTAVSNHTPDQTVDLHYLNPWQDRGGVARGWLARRDFVIWWDNTDHYADWRGVIHSS
jgi:uncharacterized protein (TIGR02996 family)